MRGGPSGRFADRRVDPGRAPLGQDQAVGAGGFGGSNDRADVMRIGQVVEQDQQAAEPAARTRKDVAQATRTERRSGRDTPWCALNGNALEERALLETDRHVTLFRLREQLSERRVLCAIRSD